MLKEIWGLLKEAAGRILVSRLFALALVFAALFYILTIQLFQLQIIHGEEFLAKYQDKTLRTVTTVGTRGNIYDKDGKLLAYNEIQYNITIEDNGSYGRGSEGINRRNLMLYRLAEIIEKYKYSVKSQYKLKLASDGVLEFGTSGDSDKRQLIANITRKKAENLTEADLNMTAEQLFQKSKQLYQFDKLRDEKGKGIELSKQTALDMIGIIYTMRLTAYQRYMKTTIAENVSRECMAEILELKGSLLGVDIENVAVRKYNYAPYLSHIVGYTGQLQESQLAELRKQDPDYAANDIVGVWGLEKSEENVLKGKKGKREMYLNSVGSILQIVSETDAKSGNDIYTTISANDQISIYHLLEQELAGILSSKISESDNVDTRNVKQSQIMIPLRDAYFQLINNNVLHREHFTADDAGMAEQQIISRFRENKEQVLSAIEAQLADGRAGTLSELPQDMQAYIVYIYDYLCSSDSGIIDPENPHYRQSQSYSAWKEDRISLHNFILNGIEESWIDTSKLELSAEYSDTESIFSLFTKKIAEHLREDPDFDKLLYKYAIANRRIPGNLLLMAMFEQGVLAEDDAAYQQLAAGDPHFAYSFLIDKIKRLQITPAQLALDPCYGSVVVTDVRTGKVRALVTYPGFDNNRISDPEYLKKCNEDLSLPLLNCSTQTQLAPGSSFKPITSVASLEEKVIDLSTVIDCTGKYDLVTPNIRCWIYPSHHGNETLVDGIKNSCNFFFADLGHRLATDSSGNYDSDLGMSRIQKYASLFGLDRKTGLELDEAEPRISDYDPERSAMGQGNHAFNNAQLSRYITAVANGGLLFRLSIIDRVQSPSGDSVQKVEPELLDRLSISQNTWSAVHRGLREVITDGVAKNVFMGQNITVAGKTGTAQEREDRGNHAVFVSYAPYEDPQISVTVTIPYGYSSGNAANLANMVYDYCFGKTTMDQILAQDASSISSVNVSD